MTEDPSYGLGNVTSPYLLIDRYDGIINDTNEADLPEAPTLTSRALIKAAILALMASASISANVSTLVSIAMRKRKGPSGSSTLYTLLLQLAVADLLVSIWCLSGEAAWTYTVEWKGSEALCKMFKFSQVFSLYLSTSTMILIGFDRLFAIRRPIDHRSCVRPVGFAWVISALLASPQLAVFRVLEGPFREPFYQCVTYGFYTEEWQEQLYSIFSLLTMFVIPLIALVSCYVCIFYTIAKEKESVVLGQGSSCSSQQVTLAELRRQPAFRMRRLAHQRNSRASCGAERYHHHNQADLQRRGIFKRAKMKSLRISLVIVSAFVICWAPYYFMMITFIFLNPDEQLGQELQSAIFFFGMSNSLINPLIYGAFHLCQRRPSIWKRRILGSFSTGRTRRRRESARMSIRAHLPHRETLRDSQKSVRFTSEGSRSSSSRHRRTSLLISRSQSGRYDSTSSFHSRRTSQSIVTTCL